MENKVCPVCKETKPRKQFKRFATLAQTKAWLNNPNATKRMTYFGKECNSCHQQTKRKTTDLTPNELHRRLINEGLQPVIVEARVAERRAKGSKKKSVSASRTMKARWQSKKSEQ